ncbi:aldose 1-epimerase [Streptomyces sannanensis]|uniref:Aldose 1-epimerase n=1 Tax=Streptomyces sannanensis TaxID=285536 RepID=A0ABP6SD95_9ACTN
MSTEEQNSGTGVRLVAGDAELTVHPENGCRIGSLRIGGTEVLRQGEHYGSFPMVPWCGRMENGQFRTGGVCHQLPLNAAPHAIHGTARDAAWRTALPRALGSSPKLSAPPPSSRLRSSGGHTHEQGGPACAGGETEAVFTHDLADPWPYTGRVTQIFELEPDRLTIRLGIETYDDSFPAQAGWHPWFLRNLGAGGEDVRLDFAPTWQEERGADHLPTGRRIQPGPGPWDDCFGMEDGVDVTLTWPGQLELKVTAGTEWVVIYDEQPEAVCVEPQSGPPNGINTLPRLVTPIDPLELATTWSWRRL